MNSETILQSDVLDIVFEKRNKLYGAYTLRKFYNNRLFKSIGITLGMVTFLSAFTLIPTAEHRTIEVGPTIILSLKEIKKQAEPKKEIPKPKETVAPQRKFLTPLIVKENPDTIAEVKPQDIISNVNVAGDPRITALIAPVSPAGGGEAPVP